MSRHVDTVKAIYESFGKGDIAAILARLDPDVEWEYEWGSQPLRWCTPRRGRQEEREAHPRSRGASLTFGANGLVTRLRHLLDSHQRVLATRA
jgi:ketosteroid isomerase-like protein